MANTTRRRPRLSIFTALSAFMVALAIAGCSGSGGSGGGDGGPVKLRFAYFAGEKTSFGQLWTWWMDEVERRSEGSIEFERFWDATLLEGPEMANGLRDGRVDVAQITPPMYPGKFPLTSVTELPFASDNTPAGATAISELLRTSKPLQQEWSKQQLKPLAWNIAAPGALGSKSPIRRAADLRGKRIRGIDRSSKVLGSAGANLINLDVNEIYGSMQRDLIEGYFGIPFAFVGPLKLTEVSNNIADVGLGITTANALSMSQQGWERLTPEQRKIMTEVSNGVPAKLQETDKAAEDASCKEVRSSGIRITRFSDGEIQKLRSAGEAPLKREWEQEAAKSDVQPEAFYRQYITAVRAGEKRFPDFQTGLERCEQGQGAKR